MRKNKLIELLNSIPGNPDIVIWNGFVGDIQDIDSEIVERELVKHTKEQEWDFPNPFVKEDEFKYWYGNRKKKIFLLQMKERGKTFFDRSGKIEY